MPAFARTSSSACFVRQVATEGAVHTDKDHAWHMTTINSFVDPEGGLLMATPYQIVDLADPASEATATGWWTALTESGGEGAVVKPLSFVATGSRGLLQPAVKCRGREYLRIIYGPEYTLPNISRSCGSGGCRLNDRWPFGSSRWDRRPRTIRPARTPQARPRMRVRSPRPGERAGRSSAIARSRSPDCHRENQGQAVGTPRKRVLGG